jgi:integrase
LNVETICGNCYGETHHSRIISMGRPASYGITKPHPSPKFRDTVRLHQYRRSRTDDIWCATFKINGHWETRKPINLKTRDWDEACETARDKYTLAVNGTGVATVLRAYKPQEPAAPATVAEHAFSRYAELAIAKLRQRAAEEDARVSGKGHNFRTLAHRIENDLLPRWGNVAITAITEHALNDWIADDFRVEDTEATQALAEKLTGKRRQPRDATRKVVWKPASQTTLGNMDWGLLHVWQEAVAAKVVDRRQRPMIDKGLGEDGERRPSISEAEVQAVADVMSDAWVASSDGHGTDMKRLLRAYVAMIACTGIRTGLEAKRVQLGHVRFEEQHGIPVILIQVIARQGKHKPPRRVIVFEGNPAFDVRALLTDLIAWRKSQGAKDTDYLFTWPDGSFPVFRDALDSVLTDAKALHDPMSGEKRVAYSFRHYFATMLLGRGVPIAVVADWLGTSSAMIERHYKDAITGGQAHLLNGSPGKFQMIVPLSQYGIHGPG